MSRGRGCTLSSYSKTVVGMDEGLADTNCQRKTKIRSEIDEAEEEESWIKIEAEPVPFFPRICT